MRVMIVDDEQAICDGLTGIVSRNLAPEDVVIPLYDSIEALERMKDEPIDLLITDISMPEMDGLELTRRAREMDLVNHIIIVTGFNEFEYAREALRQRADEYLLKPIDKEELITNLRKVSESLRGEDISFDSLTDLVMGQIDKTPLNELYLEKLGEKLSLSGGYISRLVKDKTGEGFLEYVTKLRMDESLKLLADPRLSIEAISKRVGFSSPRQFYRQFKRFFGSTPTQYRHKKRKTAGTGGL